MTGGWLPALAAAAVLAGCAQPRSRDCPGGGVCSPGRSCIEADHALFCAPATCGDDRLDLDETCDDGNNVSVDGRLTGEHQLVATKPGFLTASKTLVFVPGKLTTYEIPHLELEAAFGMGRRWDSWIPWIMNQPRMQLNRTVRYRSLHRYQVAQRS